MLLLLLLLLCAPQHFRLQRLPHCAWLLLLLLPLLLLLLLLFCGQWGNSCHTRCVIKVMSCIGRGSLGWWCCRSRGSPWSSCGAVCAGWGRGSSCIAECNGRGMDSSCIAVCNRRGRGRGSSRCDVCNDRGRDSS